MRTNKPLDICLGGIVLRLRCADQPFLRLAREALQGFVVAARQPQIEIVITLDPQIGEVDPYHCGNPHRTNVAVSAQRLLIRGSVYTGSFDLKSLRAEVVQGAALEPLYLFLRAVVAAYFPTQNGFLIHAASVAKNGAAFLFAGPPQAGKSTVARLSQKYQVLSDDFSIVRKIDGRYYCFASPFWGHVQIKGASKPDTGRAVLLKGLYLIKQDNTVYLRSVPRSEANLRLLQNVLALSRTAAINQELLRIADDFARTVPVKLLHFKKDDSFWKEIS